MKATNGSMMCRPVTHPRWETSWQAPKFITVRSHGDRFDASARKLFGSFVIDRVDAAETMETGVEVENHFPGGNCMNTQKRRQELLWQDFFLDPAQWWDNRQDKRSPRQPDFSHKMSKEALWLDNRYKPAWVDIELARWDAQRGSYEGRPPGFVSNEMAHILSEEVQLTEAVELLDRLVQRGAYVDTSLLYQVLKRCMTEKNLVLGRHVHTLSQISGYESNAFLASHTIRMYASHGKLEEAMQVFNKVAAPNTYMWASIIMAHSEHGQSREALKLYRQMRQSPVKPNNNVFFAVLKACACAADLAAGQEVHADILGGMFEPDMFVGSCLVDMYSKCGSIEDARSVFDKLHKRDVVTWNAMIAGYAHNGLGREALALYAIMQQGGVPPPNHVTFVCLLQACATTGNVHQGKELHAQIQQRGLESDVVVGNSLVNMYAKSGCLEDARRLFDRLPQRDVVTWNVMITGYAHQGLGQEALALYAIMQQDGIIPADHVTFVCLLQACASAGALHQGKQLHAQLQQRGLEADLVIGNSLVNMYSKCGSLKDAHKVFDRLCSRDVVTWNALLNGYAENSHGLAAVQLFTEMLEQGVEPDGATFICLLVACCHEGLVSEGRQYFKAMVQDHGIVPTMYHYNCMVDLVGRSGQLDEAENMLQTMPFQNHVVGWTSLLSACKSHGDIERGKRCFDRLVELEPEDASSYVLLENIYASAGMWNHVDRIESMRKSAGAKKKPAKACIEVNQTVHEFRVGEEKHGMSSKLGSVGLQLKDAGGHLPHTELVLKPLSEGEKEDALCGHAEKLALAYGLLNTPAGTTLLVTKNLRMCNDCHSSTKVMSRLEKRGIIVRDGHRVHHFADGFCTCGDRH